MSTKVISLHNNMPLNKVAMLLLALFPLLHWYDIGLPIGLGEVLMILLSFVAIATGKFRRDAYPLLFIVVWAYVAINWYHYNVTSDLKSLLPGGIVFFIFVINVGSSVSLFNIDYLQKYMKWVVIIATSIFIFQFFLLHLTGAQFCFVPNLTGHFLYEDLTYDQLSAKQLNDNMPCAFFLEKSYMAYYMVIYLCLELFSGKGKEKLFSKLSIIIIITLLLLQSGSGIVGMVIPVSAIFLKHYWQKGGVAIISFFLTIPIFALIVLLYASTDMGAAMLGRHEELVTDGTSGFTRVLLGYTFYDKLEPMEKLFGISVADINDLVYLSYADKKFPLNGIQAPLVQLGLIGLIAWALFYLQLFVKNNALGRACVLVYVVFSAIEVTYLGPYMTLLTVIPCACILNNKFDRK